MRPLTSEPRYLLSWKQHKNRSWSCREGGVIWKSGARWAWSIAGRSGFAAGLAAAIFAAGGAWRGEPDALG